ncbi:hypothetical protein BS47DRAFT_1352545 [Hydnum rufescens UP504]|uniref:Serine aminopeptidase S33 domain-containing protein n=1 Tax=Hydnum rufescens UP504 TaxID=1448309 RepID=A0A9P6AIV6_9AGAM|nr:hypothetical protein BS47DRAFT_1352545 [Hydnum rufescens UP504]
MSVLRDVIISPLLSTVGIFPPDPTFGRYVMEPSEEESKYLFSNPALRVRMRRVFITRSSRKGVDVGIGEGQDVKCTADELQNVGGKEWIFYRTVELDTPEAAQAKARGSDLVLLHGKWTPHTPRFLAMGFRIILIDLAAHGKSTGLHVHLPNAFSLAESVHAVLTDLKRLDPEPRKTFLAGSSMGGWTSRYPAPPNPISGLFLVSPLIGIAPESFPPYPIYLLGKILRHIVGRLPLTAPIRGKVSDDPRVEEEFYADERSYRGNMRIATGFALLEGSSALLNSAPSLSVPLRIVHGSHDRATDHRRSVEFYKSTPDVQCKIYEGYEHVMLKVGVDAADDAKRQAVLADMENWLSEKL